jgi:hypothetical protein
MAVSIGGLTLRSKHTHVSPRIAFTSRERERPVESMCVDAQSDEDHCKTGAICIHRSLTLAARFVCGSVHLLALP